MPSPPCQHKSRKDKCIICSGCPHNKIKAYCIECGGSQMCDHGRYKQSCTLCGGKNICEHKRVRTCCFECGGSQMCEHGKRKSKCIDCHGATICEHKKDKTRCKECRGSGICGHDKFKFLCLDCGGSALCKADMCETKANAKYNGYCMRCCIYLCPEIQVSRNYKTKEYSVVERIKSTFADFDWIHDKQIKDGCSKRRPDLFLDMGTHIIIVEVDENCHASYDDECEHKRIMQISRDVAHRPIVLIRFNPDGYGKSVKSPWQINKQGIFCIAKTKEKEWTLRLDSLCEQIQYWSENPSEKTLEIIQLFY